MAFISTSIFSLIRHILFLSIVCLCVYNFAAKAKSELDGAEFESESAGFQDRKGKQFWKRAPFWKRDPFWKREAFWKRAPFWKREAFWKREPFWKREAFWKRDGN